MPWVDRVDSILQAWYSGNEVGNAVADVLFGRVNPSGRLPLTFPQRIEDVPSFLNFGSENGKVHYREDLFVGYKHYQARKIKPLFPFGCELSSFSRDIHVDPNKLAMDYLTLLFNYPISRSIR